ncbi:XRE family transcriptional regulator [Streptomyces sp. NA04227]|uniref:helix-turn-helix domain-containing protein n=1 Tax=Streptomyces sp. NA04227 TaxID=2742136 RepID=UPI00158FDDB6|nr:XRE family transcriptional regulator [Streptomyces sp. NA04227]QKW08736.1 XRE family transcriptional regulator [Streptomyces sp. NA04227]
MPRWRELSEELDPEIREFAGQLRRLVDRSGLSLASLSDRTGYSKTSWERYLNGRLLAPKGAVIALAEVTRTNPVHLTTLWELAERAWSRSEMRHDMTMQAIRISQARAALGGEVAEEGGKSGRKQSGASEGRRKPGGAAATSDRPAPTVPEQRRAKKSRGAADPAGAADEQPPARDEFPPLDGTMALGPQALRGRPADPYPAASRASGPAAGGPGGPPGPGADRPVEAPRPRRRRRPVLMTLAAVLVVAIAAVLTMRLAGGNAEAGNDPAPSPTVQPTKVKLPEGVECAGADCTGRDPEEMGCAGEYVETSDQVVVGTAVVEIRWSKTCQAAWARIKSAAAGDGVRITNADGAKQNSTVGTTTDAYTAMVAAKEPADVTACGILATGTEGCTGE